MTTGESSAAPQVLRRQLGRKPVLWVGAGLSRQADPPLPTLWQLAKGLADAPIGWLPLPELDDPYALFDRCLDEGIAQPGELHDYLESRLRPDGRDPKPGALHRHLAALAHAGTFPFVVDPNYDLLLRRAMQELRAPHTHSTLEQNLARPQAGTWYLSIHGDLNDWSKVVLTRASYRRFDERYRFLRAQFDLLLLKHPVLFVGSSLTDPRLLEWAAGLDESARASIKTWVALVGPGEKAKLALEVLGPQLQVIELPSFEALPDWFEELARPARLAIEGEGRALTVDIDASDERWRVEAAGQVNEVPPPDLGDAGLAHPSLSPRDVDPFAPPTPPALPGGGPLALGAALLRLRSLAGHGFETDKSGKLLNPADAAVEQSMLVVARSIGAALTALLPPAGRSALAALAGTAAQRGEGLVRVRVGGPRANAGLTLPWELLLVGDHFPVARGELGVAREAVAEGVTEGLPSPPPRLSVVAHVAAPQHESVPELNLEEAAFRMARALVSLEDRTYFTDLGTLDDLERAAQRVKPVLLHFAGHGLPGRLLFEDRDGGLDAVETNRLLLTLRQAMGRLPSAIWLSCCYGAGLGGPERRASRAAREWGLLGPQSASIAADLHRAGVPQVLGYFGPVPDPLAVEVDRSLFEALARTGSTLQAMRAARLRTQEAIDTGEGWARFPLAWTLLGLYHRGDDVPLLAVKGEPERALAIEPAIEREPEALYGLEALNHGFIGRRRLLATLRRHRSEGHNVLGLYGLGGLGKTATMIRLARIFSGGGKGWQDRVVAVSLQKCDKSFAGLRESVVEAVSLHPARPADWDARLQTIEDGSNDRGVALARVLLGVLAGRIVYLDNAETLQVDPREGASDREGVPWCDAEVASFFRTLCARPPSTVTVLLTTRYRPDDKDGVWVPIEPCTKDEIFRMTRWFRTLRLLPPSLRAELAGRHLAGHPRAVEWADALIEDRVSKWRDEGYHLREDTPVDEVRTHVFEPALARLPEKASSDLLLKALIEHLPSGPGALLGECCAIGLPVPLEVVRRLGQGSDVLQARGLLTSFEGRGWAVHAFVREAVERASAGSWTKAGRGVLADYWLVQCDAEGGAPEVVWKEALEHLVASERWTDALRVVLTLDDTYRQRGWVRARVDLFEDLVDRVWPDAEQGAVLHRFSSALFDAGCYPEAEQRATESIALTERMHGTREHLSVATSLYGLANALESQGRYAQAEDIYRECLAITERVCGTREHASVAVSLQGLANTLWSQGRHVQAEGFYRESIAIAERAYDTREHPSVAVSLHGLANTLNNQGHHVEAEASFREAIAIKERVYGTRAHPDVAASLHGLATALQSQSRYIEAEGVFREAIAIAERAYSTREHASVAVSLHGLANALESQGRHAQAEGFYRESIAIAERAYGTREHAKVASSLHGLANALESQGHHAQAEGAYREAIAIKERVYGTRAHPDVAASLQGLANVHIELERLGEAERCLVEVVAIESAVFGSRRKPETIPTMTLLAQLLLAQGRASEALAYASDAWEGSLEAKHLVLAIEAGPVISRVLAEIGREDEAFQIVSMVVALLQKLPEDHPVRIAVEHRIGHRS